MRARVTRQARPFSRRSPRPLSVRPLCQAVAVMVAVSAATHAHAQAMMNLGQVGARMGAPGAAGGAGMPGMPSVGVSPQQALQASQPSIVNLARAAQGIAAQMAAQQAAAAAAAAQPSTVPNGLAIGGLQVAPGAIANSALWQNANLPTQSVDGRGGVTVDVKQTGQSAVLTWQTMNVGRQTTLNFDQSGGTQANGANNWAVLNRVADPSGLPSQILGSVKAQGSVFVINRDGILFGAGSQVNVHSLVASSLDFLNMTNTLKPTAADIAASNQQFFNQLGGLRGTPVSNATTGALGLANGVALSSAGQYVKSGDVTIERGASISTHANGTATDGGFVLIAAPNVTNAGAITTGSGQAILAAGIGVGFDSTTSPALVPRLTGSLTLNGQDVTPTGTLVNTGIVQADKGYVNLLGSRVRQDGVVGVTTGVSNPGAISISTADEWGAYRPDGTLDSPYQQTSSTQTPSYLRAGVLSFGPGSVTTVLPDANGGTATSGPNGAFSSGSIALLTRGILMQPDALIEAPGATVSAIALTSQSVRQTAADSAVAPGRIYLDRGATIDVSGLADVQLPAASALLTVARIGQNELADSPLLRNSFLFTLKNVVVDSTLTGTNADGLAWVGSPILNLSGLVSLMPRSVNQLLTNGGTITLAGDQVMTAQGSSLNLNGGYVHYLGGTLNTTRLIDANGAIVPIGQANPYTRYVGIAGQFVESHPRWQVNTVWYNPLLTGGAYQADYIAGGNAGTLNVFAAQAAALDGAVSAQAFAGARQVQGSSQPVGGTFALGAAAVAGSASSSGNFSYFDGQHGGIVVRDHATPLADLLPGFGAATPLAALSGAGYDNVLAWTTLSTDMIRNAGFSNVSAGLDTVSGTQILVPQGSQLRVQPGGSIAFSASVRAPIAVLGDLIAPGGKISLSMRNPTGVLDGDTPQNITIGPRATVSAAGQWVNNALPPVGPSATTGLAGTQFINGGSISISVDSKLNNATKLDTSGSVVLQPGSVLDVSSGGVMQADGTLLMTDGIARGQGGSITLSTYASLFNGDGKFPAAQPVGGKIVLGGTLRGAGLAGGGALTLHGLGFLVGDGAAPAWATVLPAEFFSTQGFGQYVLNAVYDAGIAPGTTVRVTQRNLLPDASALQHAATGSDLNTGGLTTVGTLDAYHRQPTSVTMTGGEWLNWVPATDPANPGTPQALPAYPGVTGGVTLAEGASIIADPGAAVRLGSPAQVTVLGSIVAPGGSIVLSADSSKASPATSAGQVSLSSGYFSPSHSVWLGSNAVLDAQGVALANPFSLPQQIGATVVVPQTGKVLAGGSVILSDLTGSVVAQPGSRIDVSGSAARFDQLQADGTYRNQPVWSDAGTLTLGAGSGLFFNSTLAAQGGASGAQGGTVTVLPFATTPINVLMPGGQTITAKGAQALLVQQSGVILPDATRPGAVLGGGANGMLRFSLDTIADSGVSTLVLGNAAPANPNLATPIAFAGNIDLTLANALILNTPQLVALPSGATGLPALTAGTRAVGAPTVTLNAPYVALSGSGVTPNALQPVAALGDGTLNVNARFIDVQNQLQLNRFARANLTSSGDIRLSSLAANGTGLRSGLLYSAGDLTLSAANVYPASGSTFVIDAVGPTDASTGKPAPTTVTFRSNGAGDVPLSAGGSLLVDATRIVQAGVVRAPSGSVVLGVDDPTDKSTQALFGGAPLTATQSVTLAPGSITSVSNGGRVLPYGVTVDGTQWQYNPLGVPNVADVTAPPAKLIRVSGAQVDLQSGATIDLTGGGDLRAIEWVPGTGGSRDLLARYNVSYATNAAGAVVPVNPGAADVYAILPGYAAPVAAYDPVFAQITQPSAASSTGASARIGVGQAGAGAMVGQAVYLQGVPGLAAGVYTLLPAKYATLPGAFRVVAQGATPAVGMAGVLPDGSALVAGYQVNALSGSRSATPTQFIVQSGPAWQQYSQYNATSANTFFAQQATKSGSTQPALPRDAGQLVLAATQALRLGASLKPDAAPGGASASVDIASRDIQITAANAPALNGYLQIDAGQLDALGAGSLLIGGTRTQTRSGITIDTIANSVVVSNDANSALTGPEILLVTKTDGSGVDPNAARGLEIQSGSVVKAAGSYPAAAAQPITIGRVADSTAGTTAVAGDGALLRVSNGGPALVTRSNVTGATPGLLKVGANTTLNGGASLTLDSSGDLRVDPSAQLAAKAIAVNGSIITFTNERGAGATQLPGFVIGPDTLAQFGNTDQLTLRSRGAMHFADSLNVTFGKSVDLSAATFVGNGGGVTLNGQRVVLSNELGGAAAAGAAGSGTLTVNAQELDFGAGDKRLAGFGSAVFNASSGIVGQQSGSFDFGALPVTMNAPVYLADSGSSQRIVTTGALNLNAQTGTALTRTVLGGQLSFTGGTLSDNGAQLLAPSGNLSLRATAGDLTIGAGSLVGVAGVTVPFYDVNAYGPAGAIALSADQGAIRVASGATLDFSGAQGGGAAGSLAVSAPKQAATLAGTLKGGAAKGYRGGAFTLDTGAAADLDGLARLLATSGVTDTINVRSRGGNLVLSQGNTLAARVVGLTADGGAGGQNPGQGNVRVLGTIDASGAAGGNIVLYGKSGVDIEGTLRAAGSDPKQRGGTVQIGTTGQPDTVGGVVQLNPAYGYENVSAANSGAITLGPSALIDVSGGTAGGLSGGTVGFRAPLLANGDVNVTAASGARIAGSRDTGLEAYAVWSTTDPGSGPKHFDGVVDPAGWYDRFGRLVAGTFTDATGKTTVYTPQKADGTPASMTDAQVKQALQSGFFTPSAANADHQSFYGYLNGDATKAVPGTVMGFVQKPGFTFENRFAGIDNFHARPGVELLNPSAAVNGGDILVQTNWNLGAGASAANLAYRYRGQGPVVTLSAVDDVKVNASLTDGFFQIANPTQPGLKTVSIVTTITPPKPASFTQAYQSFALNPHYVPGCNPATAGYCYPKYGGYDSPTFKLQQWMSAPAARNQFAVNAPADQVAQYYGLYQTYVSDLFSVVGGPTRSLLITPNYVNVAPVKGQPVLTTRAPTAADMQANPNAWLVYEAAYRRYVQDLATWTSQIGSDGLANSRHPYNIAPLTAPPAVLTALIQPGTITTQITTGTPAPVDNTPAPVARPDNPLPLLSAALNGGGGASFRLVAGADPTSANPLALQPTGASGDILVDGHQSHRMTTDGHFTYNDPNSRAIVAPTLIRTNTGSIDLAAARDISLLDTVAPGAIYTAGAAAPGAPVGTTSLIASGGNDRTPSGQPNFMLTPAVNPQGAGDVTIRAQRDVTGVVGTVDVDGSVTGTAGAGMSQFWWPWMQLGNTYDAQGNITQTSINYGAFDQGVLSAGGNVSVSAGGNVTNLAVSLPTTWYKASGALNVIGGGNLDVRAGGDIRGGDYFVANGSGTITAGGRLGASTQHLFVGTRDAGPMATILATQNGVLDVSARTGADIGGIFNPSYLSSGLALGAYHIPGLQSVSLKVDSQSYSPTSAVKVLTSAGNLTYGGAQGGNGAPNLSSPTVVGAAGAGVEGMAAEVLPASLGFTALSGSMAIGAPGQTYPSANGQLNLLANGTLTFADPARWGGWISFGMSDGDASWLPSPMLPLASFVGVPPAVNYFSIVSNKQHAGIPLHQGDTTPVRIYSNQGSIVTGMPGANGIYQNLLALIVGKAAQIYAGGDIVNLALSGQNLRQSDVTRIVAGGDIFDLAPTSILSLTTSDAVPSIVLGGPGTLDIQAGGNLGPFIGQLTAPGTLLGINTVGNTKNPYLPHESAQVQIGFGVGPGADYASFITRYVDPANARPAGVPDTTPALVTFMERYVAGQAFDTGLVADQPAITLTSDQAWTQFRALPPAVQQIFARQVLFSVLASVGADYNNAASPYYQQYARGYQAIGTLFPASLGYTSNTGGPTTPVTTGNLDIRNTTIQTQQGGDITIVGPGGQALIGSSSAPPGGANAGKMGIIALEKGAVNVYTDQSMLLAQSRIFTEQGGDMTLWSANGDINGGKGSKSVADIPPPLYTCDRNQYCLLDARGVVTGAGIASLQTVTGGPLGTVNLIASHGTVDAGDAGIRAGNLNVAALRVVNADNIQVQGTATGIPVMQSVNTGALTAASAAASAAGKMAQDAVNGNASGGAQRRWVISASVESFGGDSDDPKRHRKL